jgi:uncharacterized protein (DUF1330 family)
MSNATLPAYLIAVLERTDHDAYMQRYATPVIAQLAEAGAELLAVTPTPAVLEGEWPGNWTVLIRFPSLAAAEAWYNSPAYAPYKALRMNELTRSGSVVMTEGFDPATLGL